MNWMRRFHMRKQAAHRIANASRVADFRKGLDERGVDLDSARAIMQKLKPQQPLGFADGARVAKFILRWGGILGYVRSVRRQANDLGTVRATPPRGGPSLFWIMRRRTPRF
jgi:hypothetical protein